MSTFWDSSTIKSNKHHHSSDVTVRPNQRLGSSFLLGISRRTLQWEAMSNAWSPEGRPWICPKKEVLWSLFAEILRTSYRLIFFWRHHIKAWTALRLFSCKGGWPPTHSASWTSHLQIKNNAKIHPRQLRSKTDLLWLLYHHKGMLSPPQSWKTVGPWGATRLSFANNCMCYNCCNPTCQMYENNYSI